MIYIGKFFCFSRYFNIQRSFTFDLKRTRYEMSKADLTSLLSQLSVQSQNNKHHEVSSTCMKLLSSNCANASDVLRQCIIALIKQDKYQQCLKVLTKYETLGDSESLTLEKLYVYYKLSKTKSFEKLYSTVASRLEEIKTRGDVPSVHIRGLLHVRAQFCYKIGKHQEAFRIYQYLASHNSDGMDNEVELACNERAPSTHLPDNSASFVTQLTSDSFDLFFNESMIFLGNGQMDVALNLLKKARTLAASEGTEDDLHSIDLQIAYVYQLSGNNAESKLVLNRLMANLKPQSTMLLLAQNNLKSFTDLSKYTTNFSLLLRELNVERINSSSQNFTEYQWQILNTNLLVLQLFNNSSIQRKSSILSRTLATYQEIVDNVTLEPYESQATKLFHHVMKSISCGISGSVIGVLLLAVQLQILEKKWERAIQLCESFLNKDRQAIEYEQRVICYILFQLYEIAGRDNSRHILLGRLFEVFTSERAKEDPPFWRQVGFKLLAQESVEDANAIFSELKKLDPTDTLLGDSPRLGTHELDGELESLIDMVDVQQLIDLGSTPFERKTKKTSEKSLKRVHKRKRVHKNRKLPIGYDSEKLPNPERWLPLRDRSDYRPNKKQLAKQTQGGASNRKMDQSLDISKKKQPKKGRKRR